MRAHTGKQLPPADRQQINMFILVHIQKYIEKQCIHVNLSVLRYNQVLGYKTLQMQPQDEGELLLLNHMKKKQSNVNNIKLGCLNTDILRL